ncbi:MAG: hypothetical protein Q7V53_04855, partial [Caldisericota bacterium]|nr:hypothetical protein [Caldisericota bacterium]
KWRLSPQPQHRKGRPMKSREWAAMEDVTLSDDGATAAFTIRDTDGNGVMYTMPIARLRELAREVILMAIRADFRDTQAPVGSMPREQVLRVPLTPERQLKVVRATDGRTSELLVQIGVLEIALPLHARGEFLR